MTWQRFLVYVVFTSLGFFGLVIVFALVQSWLERGFDEDKDGKP